MLWLMYTGDRKPDPGMMVNGMLAGLVAITAPCAFTSPAWSMVIGSIAGVLVIYAVRFIEKMGIDDPVGAVAVHGVCGSFGVLCVGIFANGSYGAGWNGSNVKAVTGVVAGEWGQLGAQALALVVLWTVIFGLAFAFFKVQNAFMKGGIRPPAEEELEGMDMIEMGAYAYPAFHPADGAENPVELTELVEELAAPVRETTLV
jgi:Amt family ammonium transporter